MNGSGDGYKLGQKGECGVNRSDFTSPRNERGEAATDADGLAPYVPRGFTRRVGIALAGSSGQGCLG